MICRLWLSEGLNRPLWALADLQGWLRARRERAQAIRPLRVVIAQTATAVLLCMAGASTSLLAMHLAGFAHGSAVVMLNR